ncbi:MAG: tRNA (guanosine(37)-N1)-methyltransferase TrmD [Helicobacteraceae bacterium]|jgi:tRNA (guanine37-N1)-methyltransferase|nr:tRNA (guanosine(37)-N1)-methyltransferase TrmD [Helicobacteraceae bacterium]
MRFSFVTIFESLIAPYFADSILKRAIDNKLLAVETINPRDFSTDKWRRTDDVATGGGAGMVMTPQPLFDCLNDLKRKSPKVRILFMTPCAKKFGAIDAKRLAVFDHIAFVCGRYEGFDERAIEVFADEVLSIGDFVLTGGELPAVIMCDAIARFIDGTLGNSRSAMTDSFENGALEAPAFTKPALFRGVGTPGELLGGNHKAIESFRSRLSELKTRYFRPDLI